MLYIKNYHFQLQRHLRCKLRQYNSVIHASIKAAVLYYFYFFYAETFSRASVVFAYFNFTSKFFFYFS